MAPSTSAEVDKAHETLTDTFRTGKTKRLAWRKWQLKQIWWLITDNEEAIVDALHADLHRHEFETYFADIATVKADILEHLSKIDEWTTDEIPHGAGFAYSTLCQAKIRREPLGVALIIGAWNFPFYLIMRPLVAAVTAGCCCLLKPSELAPCCETLIADLVGKHLDAAAFQVVTGGPQETTKILEKRFDQIFYTGNPGVGKIIQKAAATYLTPTILELGGQCPVVVTKTASLDLAAKRIAFFKFFNAGQVCLAPNHVLVDPRVHDEFVVRSTFWMNKLSEAESRDQIVHIVNDRHYDRLVGLLADSKGEVLVGGETGGMDKASKYIPPTLIKDVSLSDSTMSQEIFGPLLPVIKADFETACTTIQSMEHPLALYIFSHDRGEIETLLTRSNSGGVTINDCVFHAAVPDAPFGGVGNSGLGAYHGKYGFEAFSHRRTIATVPGWFEYLMAFRYPPHKPGDVAKLPNGGPKQKNPPFKQGETMADQVDGRVGWERVKRTAVAAGKEGGKWVAVAVFLAAVDARCFGGQSSLVALMQSSGNALRSLLSGALVSWAGPRT